MTAAQLRALLRPRDDGGAVYIDHDGHAAIRADRVAAILTTPDDTDLIDRLVTDLARATGHTETQIRLSHGLNPTQVGADTRPARSTAQRGLPGADRRQT